MEEFKLFISNFLVYGIGGVISKIIPFIMLPLVTRMFPDTSYMGINEIFNTLSNFAVAIAMFGMYDAMFRFFFEHEDASYKKSICSTAFGFVIINSCIVVTSMLGFKNFLSVFFFGDIKYSFLILIATLGTFIAGTSVMISAPTRMENKRRVFLIINAVSPIIAYTISIMLLFWGYYEIALPLGNIISSAIISLFFFVLNKKWFSFKYIDCRKLKELFTVAIPVVPIMFIYWVFNSCDRLMISKMISVKETGVYSVAAKVGMISQLIYTAFSGGWQYFAYSTMKGSRQVSINSRIMEYLFSITFLSTLGICVLSYPLFILLFEKEYLGGFIATPYLFFAPLLQMVFQVLGSQMTIHKKTWMNMVFLCIGTLFNVGLNYFLIPVLGVEGAAIATLSGYTIAILLSVVFNLKFGYIVINTRLYLAVLFFLQFFILWRLLFSNKTAIGVGVFFLYTTIYIKLYKHEIRKVLEVIFKKRLAK